LGSGHFGAGFFDRAVFAEVFVEGEADGLDGDVGGAGLFDEGASFGVLDVGRAGKEKEDGPKDTGRDVASATDGDHEVRSEVMEDAFGGGLAQFVYLLMWALVIVVRNADMEVIEG
jgi:hypothetical protein